MAQTRGNIRQHFDVWLSFSAKLMANQNDIAEIYNNVKTNISSALTDIGSISVTHKEANQHLERLVNQLQEMRNQFESEIDFLEGNSEWEKLTVAFFGETNAGKSTILEALRIIFKEKKRQETIDLNTRQLEDIEEAFSRESNALLERLRTEYLQYSKDTIFIANEIEKLRDLYNKRMTLIISVIGTLLFLLGTAFGFVLKAYI